ncbi:hypothetical protein [Oleispirillum naphthae]|uniref:COG4315 family predicted lipoprotein n=1 Tax=Oleispirillum naphthae TaxID=2838853 RepID=UPI00308233EE
MLKPLACAAVLAVFITGTAHAADPAMTGTTAKGPALVDSKGMTLYVFDKDPAGGSACNDACAQNWPPLIAPGDAKAGGGFSVITRTGGAKQWAYKGKALYLWVKDVKPGDATGDGFRGVWHIAKP